MFEGVSVKTNKQDPDYLPSINTTYKRNVEEPEDFRLSSVLSSLKIIRLFLFVFYILPGSMEHRTVV